MGKGFVRVKGLDIVLQGFIKALFKFRVWGSEKVFKDFKQ